MSLGQLALAIKQGTAPSSSASTLWGTLNNNAARTLAPVARSIDEALKAAGAPADLRTKVVSRPLDAILDIFDPLEDAIGRAVDRVIARKGATQTFFGQRRNIARVQTGDRTKDVSTQNLLRSLRTIDAFMVLFWTQPLELAQEMLKEGFDIASATAKVVGEAAKATGDTAAKAVSDAWNNVTDFLNLSGFEDDDEGLGQGGPAEGLGAGAALGLTGAGAGIVDGIIVTAIGAIVTYVGNFVQEQITGGGGAVTPTPASVPADRFSALDRLGTKGVANTAATPLNTDGPGIPTWALALGAVAAVGAVVVIMRK